MPIQKIIQYNSPEGLILKEPAKEVPKEMFGTEELNEIIKNMADTMEGTKATGIAAPQIGVPFKVIVFGGKPSLNFPNFNVEQTALINPIYKPSTEDPREIEIWEHCLSLPGTRGFKIRYHTIEYEGYDSKGNLIQGKASGILAVLLQHEIDHLEGKLICDNTSEFGNIKDLEKKYGDPEHHKKYKIKTMSEKEEFKKEEPAEKTAKEEPENENPEKKEPAKKEELPSLKLY